MRILILEDVFLGLAAEDALTAAGHDVIGIAADPDKALSLTRNTEVDLLLVDLKLRYGSTGAEAIDAIRRETEVPALFVSGSHEECRKLGYKFALGCLKKPYAVLELVRAVAAMEVIIRGDEPEDIPWNMELYRPDSFED